MSLRIGMLAPISWRSPPRHYGPWEYVTSLLTEGLVAAGHHVTLFATADSKTNAELAAICPRPLAEDPSLDPKVWECLHIASFFERASDFDLLHNQFDFLPLSYSRLVTPPMLTTIHGFSSPAIVPVYQRYSERSEYVAISDADRHPSLNYIATIHHGIDVDAFPFTATPGDGLVFFGRIHPDKGVADAIEVARRCGRHLTIAGIVHDQSYFDDVVRPHLDDTHVSYIGSVGPERRPEVLGSATALLHLIHFDEPFGLSVVEAMACGTPVIAYPRGALPELVLPGVGGALVADVAAAVMAVPTVTALDRAGVRRQAQTRFGQARMVADYEAVYSRMLDS